MRVLTLGVEGGHWAFMTWKRVTRQMMTSVIIGWVWAT
jgi:hypothetical protein